MSIAIVWMVSNGEKITHKGYLSGISYEDSTVIQKFSWDFNWGGVELNFSVLKM